jgi:hypothetical protein
MAAEEIGSIRSSPSLPGCPTSLEWCRGWHEPPWQLHRARGGLEQRLAGDRSAVIFTDCGR